MRDKTAQMLFRFSRKKETVLDGNFSPAGRRLKIAVIGSGVAGMSAAWLLDQHHDVTVYEQDNRLGGHANTVAAPGPAGPVAVDTGFIVYNAVNYPNLVALFDHLDVPTKDSEMSFAASLDGGGFEYAGGDLNGLFGQRRNVLRPRFWRMVSDILRFFREAPDYLVRADIDDLTLGDLLAEAGYSEAFLRDHLLPIGAAIWSTTAADMRAYPAAAFIRFFDNHGLLKLSDRPVWRTVDGGSAAYVARLTAAYRHRVRMVGVAELRRMPNQVTVIDRTGARDDFDHVVIAAHADQAHAMLGDADTLETACLGGWRYTTNQAVLHRDRRLMPRRQRVWSSWNFIEGGAATDDQALCVTYWMNRLQNLAGPDLFVTLNPAIAPRDDLVIDSYTYSHPYFDQQALARQRRLWDLQGHRRTWYCGSYFGAGFHEDALQAGLAVAEALGGRRRPWEVANESGRIHVGATMPEVA